MPLNVEEFKANGLKFGGLAPPSLRSQFLEAGHRRVTQHKSCVI